MIRTRRQLRQRVAGQAVGLVAPQPRFFGGVLATRVDDDVVQAAQKTDAVLHTARPFISGADAGETMPAHVANHLRAGAVGADDVLARTVNAVKQRGDVYRLAPSIWSKNCGMSTVSTCSP